MLGKFMIALLAVSVFSGVVLTTLDLYRSAPQFFSGFLSGAKKQSPQSLLPESGSDSIESRSDVSLENDEAPQKLDVVSAPIDEEIAAQNQSVSSPTEEVSSQLIYEGDLGTGWRNNSWNVDSLKLETGIREVTYQSAWAGFSLYSSGLDLREKNSVVIELGDADMASSSYFALYQGKSRIGSVPLSSYSNEGGLIKISLYDLSLTANVVTDVLIERENPGKISVKSIAFSKDTIPVRHRTENNGTAVESSSVSGVESVPVPIHEPIVYFAGARNGWEINGRRAKVVLEDTSRSITGSSIKISFETNTSALALTHPKGISTKGYSYIRLKVYGGTTDYLWQQLYITLYDKDGKKLGTKDIAGFSGRGSIVNQSWNEFEVPLAAFDALDTVITSVDIENASITQDGDAIWIDSIEFGSY